jgi:hypothetical protein
MCAFAMDQVVIAAREIALGSFNLDDAGARVGKPA